MAKQFSFLATHIDMQILEAALRTTDDFEILSDRTPEGDHGTLMPLSALAMPASRVGNESLFCFLSPREAPRNIVIQRDSAVKIHVDTQRSHLIEVWRPFFDGRTIRRGRFYYQNRVLTDGRIVPKDANFCAWADAVMTRARKSLRLDKSQGAYVGAEASEALASNRISIIQ
jgi:hypothetical protein